MGKEPITPTGKLQRTLEEMKQKLQEEREAAETLTRHLGIQRDQRPVGGESRASKLEADLVEARKLLNEQKETTEQWIQQLTAEREAGRSRLRETESHVRKLEEDLATADGRLREQKGAAEGLIQQLAAERDQMQAQLSEMESRARAVEEELAAVQQLREQKQATEELIQQLTADRDEAKAQFSEVESRARALEEEVAAAQGQFREQREAAVQLIQQLESEQDESRIRLSELEARAQKREEELAAAREQLQKEIGKAAAGAGMPGDQVRPTLWIPDWEKHKTTLAEGVAGNPPASPEVGSLNDRRELYWRMAVPLTLVLLSTDLLAMSLSANPAMLDAVRDIQLQSQRLLEVIRNGNPQALSQNPPPEAAAPSVEPQTVEGEVG